MPCGEISKKECLECALEAAQIGGKILKKYWGKLSKIESKGYSWDLVTEADKESEKLVIAHLQSSFPEFGILSEEVGMVQENSEGYLWCLDPLDGTTNYTHQYPMVAVSIALMYQGDPVVGVTYNPILGELFQATKGEGAFLNGEKIHVSQVKTLGESLLVTGFPYDRRTQRETNYREFCYLTHLTQGVRRGGSAALDLAYVAAGRLDGYWERGLQPWDIAAGILLVREAGGKVTSYDNSAVEIPTGRLLATNGEIHEALSQAVLEAKHKPLAGSDHEET
ncbi:MAG: inositol monophosphatase family protein [Chlamydiales bacterium]